MTAGLLLALLPLLLGGAGQPAPTRRSVQDAQRDAAQARDAADAAARNAKEARAREAALSAQRAVAGRQAVAAEDAVDQARARLDAANHEAQAAQESLNEQAARLAPLLPAMRRLSAWPSETLLALPVPPEDALRGALVLRSLGRQLAVEAAAYRAAGAKAAAAAAQAQSERDALLAARDRAAAAVATVEKGLAEARSDRREADQGQNKAAQEAANSAARARNLNDALARLEREEAARARAEAAAKAAAERAAAQQAAADRAAAAAVRNAARSAPKPDEEAPDEDEALASLPAANGRALPVAGRVTSEFGAGGTAGQTWSTPPGARVVSPCSGRAVFADTFRSYGLLLIVDCGGGYHVVLAGLDRLDATVGQRVSAGEAVGVMGRPGSGRPSLYVELRRRGQAVDPRPWLASGRLG
ncbi:murein hydrolase activator EnvC family protein [Roseomonas elaeocarpi]|uniref:Murein hydrolase activator EnvC family protein n=1 Tax=Roseomonas elaeocarpi TaxID=907779 RepID=A0ABV6JZP5_9PROT